MAVMALTRPEKREARTASTYLTYPTFTMNLTPIKVRGKKRSEATARHRAALAKRKAAETAAAITPTTTWSRETTRTRQVLRKRSLLERQLPLEIIERIFLLSENVAFPRCSPLLGRLLSGHTTLIAALIAAFGPTWDAHFGVNQHQVQTFHTRGTSQRDGSSLYPGNPHFQVSKLLDSFPLQKKGKGGDGNLWGKPVQSNLSYRTNGCLFHLPSSQTSSPAPGQPSTSSSKPSKYGPAASHGTGGTPTTRTSSTSTKPAAAAPTTSPEAGATLTPPPASPSTLTTCAAASSTR